MLPHIPRFYSAQKVNFNTQLRTTVLATKPADLTLSPQKATEGFNAIVDWPTDTDIINIRQLILTILMKTKYDELTLTHNLSGVIIPTDIYEHIYAKGEY